MEAGASRSALKGSKRSSALITFHLLLNHMFLTTFHQTAALSWGNGEETRGSHPDRRHPGLFCCRLRLL